MRIETPNVLWWLVRDENRLHANENSSYFPWLEVIREIENRYAKKVSMREKKLEWVEGSRNREEASEIMKNQILEKMGEERVSLVENIYPYDAVFREAGAQGVTHYCLWSKDGQLEEEKIRDVLKEKLGGAFWVAFENLPENKSVPTLWHCHVLLFSQEEVIVAPGWPVTAMRSSEALVE